MILINLFGVPGAGKSTAAAYIFSRLKMMDINAELITEFAKDKVWEESKEVFNNQAYIFGKQYFRISRCAEKVDVVVTDSPLLLSIFYNNSELLGKEFDKLVIKVFKSFESLNYLLDRDKPYNPKGRFQTEEESNTLYEPLSKLLDDNAVEYVTLKSNVENYEKIIQHIVDAVLEKEVTNE